MVSMGEKTGEKVCWNTGFHRVAEGSYSEGHLQVSFIRGLSQVLSIEVQNLNNRRVHFHKAYNGTRLERRRWRN